MAPEGTLQPKSKGPAPLNGKKRKDAPGNERKDSAKRPRFDHGRKARDARTLSAQTTKSFKNGELDVAQFVQAREYEIKALEQGMASSRKALNRRAFQQVPPTLRRRTASHNVKRIPKRLRERGKREMAEDNTPTVNAKTRKPTRRMRLRLETAKTLRALGSKRKAEKEKAKAEKVVVHDPHQETTSASVEESKKLEKALPTKATKKPRKARKPLLATPSIPQAKFRKRQIRKSWLPTHMFHAKRAQMTPPSAPLWRFAIPLTPSAKSYRPTHRASRDRGAIAWDTSYLSVIGFEGRQDGLLGLLRALGVSEADLTGTKRRKWRQGTRSLEVLLHEREAPHTPIAPATIIWCAAISTAEAQSIESSTSVRKLLIRVHPSAFYQLWEESLRLARVAKPEVKVEDLRFEVGSIEITGPGSTEALLGALWPVKGVAASDTPDTSAGDAWTKLAGLTNPAGLPENALLSFDVQDPRLHHPPRTIKLPKTNDEQQKLLETIAAWPVDKTQSPSGLLNSRARRSASASLPSQKTVNRRKALAIPGQYPEAVEKDPRIPVLLFTSSSASSATSTASRSQPNTTSWTLLCPWKCVQPIWYSLMYYPLSTGQQPRFGGLKEERQLAFEAGQPWFPADFPGTKAGWEWEMRERREREDAWRRMPKGKRTSFEKVDLGAGKKGEVGTGWACDWQKLLAGPVKIDLDADVTMADVSAVIATADAARQSLQTTPVAPALSPVMPQGLVQLSPANTIALMSGGALPSHIRLSGALATVHLHLVTRGVPTACARIYRLPSAAKNLTLRRQWLALLPTNQKRGRKGHKHALPTLPKDAPPHVLQQRLAASLLEPARAGDGDYPACPGEEDLVGFVTTGKFDLGAGKGTGLGSVLIERVLEEAKADKILGRLCIVRNSGQGIGRLARWEVV